MSVGYLPNKELPKAKEYIKRFIDGDIEALQKELGYTRRSVMYRSFESAYGIGYKDIKWPIKPVEEMPRPEPEVINLPPVKLREYKHKRSRKGDEEEAILHASDGHACKITTSYDVDVYKTRMDTLFDATMSIVTLHRNMYPIRRLHILNTGDNSQGENPYQGSNVGSVKMGARDQTTKVAYPAWVKLIGSLKQEFEEVIVEGIPGNHGYDKLAPETSREDLRLYDLLAVYFGNTKGVTINVHEGFAGIVDILGFKCFIFHGDGIPCQQGVPFFALDRKLKSWYMQYGGFNYAFSGHFHKRHSDEISSRLEYFMCGSLVSDDEWALKKLGISSNPSQSIFGIHGHYGITWRYGLVVDKEKLPTKLTIGGA